MKKDSVKENFKKITDRSDSRKDEGKDPFVSDWQTILDLLLFSGKEKLKEMPGQILSSEFRNDDEWNLYLTLQKKLDLPPDTSAVLLTPSFSRELFDPEAKGETSHYNLAISDCKAHRTIMQVMLRKDTTSGIDVFEAGNHCLDYTYQTVDDCLDELSHVVWMFFRPKAEWSKDQVIQYTENWAEKGIYFFSMENIAFHREFSYIHHPELLGISQCRAIFKAIEVTIPKEMRSLDEYLTTINETNQALDISAPVVTKRGVLDEDRRSCEEFAGQISLMIDQYLDKLCMTEELDYTVQQRREHRDSFMHTMHSLYHTYTGKICPDFVKIF